MARKTNDILLLSALILVALATLVQSLAMRDVIANDFESEEYTTPGTIDKSIFEYQRKPYDKAKLDEYYSKYKHVSDDGQTVTLFTREQLADLSEDIKNGKRENLTLDHFFYIVEDSVELYFKYPKIRLCSTYIDGKYEEIDSIYDLDVDSFISDIGSDACIPLKELTAEGLTELIDKTVAAGRSSVEAARSRLGAGEQRNINCVKELLGMEVC